ERSARVLPRQAGRPEAPPVAARPAGAGGGARRAARPEPRADGRAPPAPGGDREAAEERGRGRDRRGARAVRRRPSQGGRAPPEARPPRGRARRHERARRALRAAQERRRDRAHPPRVALEAADGDRGELGAHAVERADRRAPRGAAASEHAEGAAQPDARLPRRAGRRRRRRLPLRLLRQQREEQRGGRRLPAAPDARDHPELRARAERVGAAASGERRPDEPARFVGRAPSGDGRAERPALPGVGGVPRVPDGAALLDARRPAEGDPDDQRGRERGEDGHVAQPREHARGVGVARDPPRRRPPPARLPPRPRDRERRGALELPHRPGRAAERDPSARWLAPLLRVRRPDAAEPGGARRLGAHARGAREPTRRVRFRDPRLAARPARDRCRRPRARRRRRGPRRQGLRHAARARAPCARPAPPREHPPPRRGREQRRHALGRPLLLQPVLRQLLRAGLEPADRRVGGMNDRLDGKVLLALQALVFGLPLFLGGRQPTAVAAASLVVLVLLALTLRERRRRGEAPHAPGIAALAGFAVLALVTTLPLPPALLRVLTPTATRLYTDMLPGWPGAGDWSIWRSVAIDPYGVWTELGRVSIALGVFAVVVAYPWAEVVPYESARVRVFARLLLTVIVAGTFVAGLGLLEQVVGNGNVLWVTENPSSPGRTSGPFVNPNHFAAWLEMIIPSGLAYAFALSRRLRKRIVRSTEAGRGMGVQRRRAWVAALVVHQQRLWAPALAVAAVLVMLVAHVGSGSRGGTAALLVGLGVVCGGIMARRFAKRERTFARRWAPIVLGLALVAASGASIVLWAISEVDQQASTTADADVSL